MIRLPFTFFLAVLTFAPFVRAEPLDRRQLPATTVWFIHVDVEAARDSVLGKGVRGLLLSTPDARKAIEKCREAIGIDITRDIQGITLYGLTYEPDHCILIVRGNVDHSRVEAMLQKLTGYRMETIESRGIYLWTEQDQQKRIGAGSAERTRAGAFFGNDEVVVANNARAVVTALDVLDGKAASLSDSSPLIMSSPMGTVVSAAASGIAEAKALSIESPIVRRCESGSVAIGEHNGQAFFRAHVVTQSAETASQIRASVEGLRAFIQLQAAQNADAAQLLEPLKASSEDKSVDLEWNFSSADLIKLVGKMIANRNAEAQAGEKQ